MIITLVVENPGQSETYRFDTSLADGSWREDLDCTPLGALTDRELEDVIAHIAGRLHLGVGSDKRILSYIRELERRGRASHSLTVSLTD